MKWKALIKACGRMFEGCSGAGCASQMSENERKKKEEIIYEIEEGH